ncbi:NAD(P)/FAD-dependent oxidoreductase [archaeon]|nr:NAD(P)/FAD-dependent oxidoreductase [archaeon]
MALSEADVVVVGGGPAGLRTAALLAERGLQSVIYEQQRSLAAIPHCAGVVCGETLSAMGFVAKPPLVQTVLNEVRVVGPGGVSVELKPKQSAYVLDRGLFDCALAASALQAGAELVLGVHVTHIEVSKERALVVTTNAGKTRCKVVVIAEGIGRILAARLLGGRMRPASAALLHAAVIQGDVEEDRCEILVDPSVAKGAFAYLIPIEDNLVKAGVVAPKGDPLNILKQLLQRFGYQIQPLQTVVHPVNLSGLLPSSRDCVIAVGDAAGHSKPTTGGGLWLIAHTSSLAADAVCRFIRSGVDLSTYERSVKQRFGSEFAKMQKARAIFNYISARILRACIRLLNEDHELRSIVENWGSMDTLGSLTHALLKLDRVARLIKSVLH